MSETTERVNRRQLESRAQTCVHFNGVSIPGRFNNGRKTCEAGVCYRTHVGGPDLGWVRKIPCTPKMKPEDELVPCELFEARGMEAAEAEKREWDEHFAKTALARLAIKEAVGEERGVSGAIDCPACDGGRLSYSVAESNGHIWGKCSAEGCASWME